MAELPFNPKNLDSNDKLIYDTLVEKRKSVGAPFDGPYAALMNHPELCQKVEALGYYLKFQGHLPRNIYQFVVLSVAQSTKAVFEWTDHVDHALAAGVPEIVIDTLKTQGLSNQQFPEPYHLAAQVLNAALVWKNIPIEVQSEAIKAYGIYGYVELVVLSGFYQMFSAINQGFDVSLRAKGGQHNFHEIPKK
ncbi:MAG: carboxymuconolactone decarboxylase family protein [Gammaproteobacteria bacterium]|nr:carboxymuconolactone decarboxylase family protein [Gammaproteobacteria bacterium]